MYTRVVECGIQVVASDNDESVMVKPQATIGSISKHLSYFYELLVDGCCGDESEALRNKRITKPHQLTKIDQDSNSLVCHNLRNL